MAQNRLIQAHVFISGKVQGVGYRYYTSRQAQTLKLSGWVKNLPDGRVEAVFEGKSQAIDKMVKWCYGGSPNAIVTDVAIEMKPSEGLQGFEMRR
ncbi:acylphosphatase [Aphanothece hegewaldii CCALA 016]|uniref:acylphosphatase n=1 Tax=Aphanothece hegewaldii CCALA 016 TaxID=2107694 RepID=A0A2T1M0F2_9CHRO|nr:acylphosphatase [Aphanothece hegewaldii]PSF38149.1 acylphosphatase [Aphanothece hegewaldii CCALA 016]